MNFKTWFIQLETLNENYPDWETLNYKYSTDQDGDNRLDFFDKNGAVGFIIWNKDDGEVVKIYVGEKLRRKGVGTHIWEIATEYSEKNGLLPPEHSSRRSYEGDQFAKAIGGYIPRLTDDITGWSGDQ